MINCSKSWSLSLNCWTSSLRNTVLSIFLDKWLRKNCFTFFMSFRLLHSDRDPIPDVPAVYFVMPTEENIDRLCQVIWVFVFLILEGRNRFFFFKKVLRCPVQKIRNSLTQFPTMTFEIPFEFQINWKI